MANLQGSPQQNHLEMKWDQIKYDLIFHQISLASYFEDKVWAEEDVTEEFKTGLRLATYLKFVMALQDYPIQINLAIGKAREIEFIFLQASHYFELEYHLDPLRVKILEFENFFWGNNPMAAAVFVPLVFHQSDPAREKDVSWIINLFPQFCNNAA